MKSMKIALMNEFSQARKNDQIRNILEQVAQKYNSKIFNVGMVPPIRDDDVPEAYTKDNPRLTYLHLGIQAAILLNAKAVDFVITGCGTGQGALMALNAFPGVVCGYCIEPTDAYLFLQINNGNALSLPYAKGFGWGADLNLENIFEKVLGSQKGMGYPASGKISQNRNARLLTEMKQDINNPFIEGLKNIDQDLLHGALTERFMVCFDKECQDIEIKEYIDSLMTESNLA